MNKYLVLLLILILFCFTQRELFFSLYKRKKCDNMTYKEFVNAQLNSAFPNNVFEEDKPENISNAETISKRVPLEKIEQFLPKVPFEFEILPDDDNFYIKDKNNKPIKYQRGDNTKELFTLELYAINDSAT